MAGPIGSLFVEVGADIQNFTKGMSGAAKQVDGFATNVGKSMQRVGKDMQRVGKDLTMKITLPILAAGGAAGKMGTDFDTEMKKITGLVGVAREQVDDWRGDLLDMAQEVGKSPQELAKGLFFVTSAGFRGTDALDVLRAAAKGSAAGLGEVELVADAVTSAVNAYGLENLSAADATGILVGTVREGKAEASAIAPVLGQLLPIASELGIGFDDVGAALAVMTRTSGNAGLAGTGLKGIMRALLKPTAEATTALADVGLSSADLRKQIGEEGLLPVLRTLEERFAGTEKGLAAVFTDTEGLTGALSILGQDAEIVDGVFGSLASGGAADLEKAFKDTDGPARAFAQGMASIQAAGIELANVLLPIVVPAVKAVTAKVQQGIRWWQSLTDEEQQNILKVIAVVAAIGPLLIIFGTLISTLGTVVIAVKAVIGIIAGGAGLLAILNPLGLAIVAIGVVVAALALAWSQNFLDIQGKTKAVVDFLGRVFEGFVSSLSEQWNDAVGTVKGAINTIIGFINALNRAWNSISFTVPRITLPSIDLPGIGRVGGGRFGGQTFRVPQMAMIPSLGTGGPVLSTGLALLHAGEFVSPAGVGAGGGGREIHVHLEVDGRELAEVVVPEMPGVLHRVGVGL